MSAEPEPPGVAGEGAPLPPGTGGILASTPAVLELWLADLSAAELDQDEGPGSFSPRDVVAHLIQGEREDWLPRVRRLLAHGEGLAFEPFDPHELGPERGAPIDQLLEEFRRLRQDNLAQLERLELGPEDASRRGRHPALGGVTLAELLATWVAHDLAHLAQTARLLTRAVGSRIGPWRALFSQLRDR